MATYFDEQTKLSILSISSLSKLGMNKSGSLTNKKSLMISSLHMSSLAICLYFIFSLTIEGVKSTISVLHETTLSRNSSFGEACFRSETTETNHCLKVTETETTKSNHFCLFTKLSVRFTSGNRLT